MLGNDDWSRIDRRSVLAASGVAATVGLAGCLGSLTGADNPEGELHERYGYPSTDMEEEPPVDADHTVELLMDPPEDDDAPPEFYFDPVGLAIDAGDVVRFEFHSPDHAVAAFHEAFGRTHRAPENAEPISSPMMEVGTYWLCQFDEPGVWDIYCPPHEFLGMGMRLVVDEASGPAIDPADPDYEGAERPPEPALAATFNAETLAPDNILDESSVPWDDIDIDDA